MIDSVLKDIRDAEEQAENMQRQAYQRGKDMILQAEAEATAQKRTTVAECKEERKSALQKARDAADERTQNMLKKGESDAEYFVQEMQGSLDGFADTVVKAVLDKYIK